MEDDEQEALYQKVLEYGRQEKLEVERILAERLQPQDSLTGQETTVYQYFAANGALIYVGVTSRGIRRLHEHAESKPWWTLATGCTLEHFSNREDALERERHLIAMFRPPYNQQHNPEAHIPLDERVYKRLILRSNNPIKQAERASSPAEAELRRRRREWHALPKARKRIAPCIRCGQRPGHKGPECLNCRQQVQMVKA